DELVPEPLAAAEATLTPAEREMGVALVDIGAGTTDLAVFVEDAVWHTAVLPIGGNHLSNDLSIVLQIPFESAEQVKVTYGRAMPAAGPVDEAFDRPEAEGFEPAWRAGSRPGRARPRASRGRARAAAGWRAGCANCCPDE